MLYNPFTLENKTVLITGASGGIGQVTALNCSKLGASVILTGRNKNVLEELVKQLSTDNNQHHSYIIADLNSEEDIIKLVSELPEIDGLVSNAGVSKMLPLNFYSIDALTSMFHTNCFAPMLLLKNLMKKKKLKNQASIVFTASISGYNNVAPACGMYGSSKSALTTYMQYAALELSSKGIRCNAVQPGRINTSMIKNSVLSDEDVSKDIEKYPLKRYGNPEDVANAIIYLLSDASSWVTGTNLVIDGGRSLK